MTPNLPHWYLRLLGTRPEWQRTGVARSLLELMLARADDEEGKRLVRRIYVDQTPSKDQKFWVQIVGL